MTTTDKPKWWQSWMVYALVGLLVTVGPYVGAYLSLGEYGRFSEVQHVSGPSFAAVYVHDGHSREFKYGRLRQVFAPLCWAEAKIRGEIVDAHSPGRKDRYEPGW
ncbi:hypothetical protein Pan258_57470 [Symmachiella dynata]|uniref:hypothetical protein n=1 Tax=Symmachiella dynata TaxID=2527995 RepID=UPI00118ABC4B|nr:hypothetical protein [Symmachiella dynata]QDT51658.1 hypothetical protein Pan258_57470 [Symmachiella dynata]